MKTFDEWKEDTRAELVERLEMWAGDPHLAEAMQPIEGVDPSYIELRGYLVAKREVAGMVHPRDLEIERLITDVDQFALVCESKKDPLAERPMSTDGW